MRAVFVYSVDSFGMDSQEKRTSVFVSNNGYSSPIVHHDLNQRTVTIYEDGEIQMVVTNVVVWRRDNNYNPPTPITDASGEEAKV